ncbi:MAG: D-alanyl-D-alanine carboxypeptidase, partial [Clostridia bacterium]|nr:D-alanyl-D-alanine carboxypeptidase [Clostridia bacterium]
YDMEHKNGRVTGLTNTNRLVRNNPDCYMAKTGHTDDAGYCIVVYGKRGGSDMIACVMGLDDSTTRFEEVTKLLNYGFTNYESQLLVEKDKPIGEVKVRSGKIKVVPYYPEEDLYGFSKKGEQLTPELRHLVDDEINAPIKNGENIGKLELYLDGEKRDETNLEVREDVVKKGVVDIVKELIA